MNWLVCYVCWLWITCCGSQILRLGLQWLRYIRPVDFWRYLCLRHNSTYRSPQQDYHPGIWAPKPKIFMYCMYWLLIVICIVFSFHYSSLSVKSFNLKFPRYNYWFRSQPIKLGKKTWPIRTESDCYAKFTILIFRNSNWIYTVTDRWLASGYNAMTLSYNGVLMRNPACVFGLSLSLWYLGHRFDHSG